MTLIFVPPPDSAYIGDERVQVRSLDSFELVAQHVAWLKVDTQGYERTYWRGQNERFGVYPQSRSKSATSPSTKDRRSPAKATKC
jgi:hypothetical protein